MNKTYYFYFVSLLVVLASCGDPAEYGSANARRERIPVVLTYADLYNGSKVQAFLENEGNLVQYANELFLKGIDAYRNKKLLDSATFYFQESLINEPTAKAYFELGNLFIDKKEYDNALSSYNMAEQLDFEPFSKILYNKACVYSLTDKKQLAGQYLEYALQAGYTNIDQISKDEDLEALRDSYYYNNALNKGLRGMSNPENLFWLRFKKLFAATDLPLKLEIKLDQESMDALKYMSYDFEKYVSEMRDEKFSREVSKGFYYHTKPYETETYVALIYVIKEEFLGEYAPLNYMLATFTHEGKLVDKALIGGAPILDEEFRLATLNEDGSIDIELKQPIYEKDPSEYGYYENTIVSYEDMGEEHYQLTDSGKIVRVDDASTDSEIVINTSDNEK